MKKYNEIWSRHKTFIAKCFDFEVVYADKYVTTKIRSKNNKIRIDFHDEGLPPQKTKSLTNSMILIDSVDRRDKSYDPEAFLE